MFKYSIRSELTRKYYERRLRRFFDFIQYEIEIKDIETRSNAYAEKGKSNIDWTVNQIIRFLQFQKERVENKEITAATLKNFLKSLKVFYEAMNKTILQVLLWTFWHQDLLSLSRTVQSLLHVSSMWLTKIYLRWHQKIEQIFS
jgi:hypothetical protein